MDRAEREREAVLTDYAYREEVNTRATGAISWCGGVCKQ